MKPTSVLNKRTRVAVHGQGTIPLLAIVTKYRMHLMNRKFQVSDERVLTELYLFDPGNRRVECWQT